MAQLRKAALSIGRYRSRSAARPTPFGLFAGVSLASFDDAAKVDLGVGHRRGVRPDRGWLLPVVSGWEQDPEILPHLTVVMNDLCYTRGDRLVLPYVTRRSEADLESAAEASVRMTPAVRATREYAATPTAVSELCARLSADFPGAPHAAILTMVSGLVRSDALLTDLRPPQSAVDPIAHLVARLSTIPAAAGAVAQLREIDARLDAYARTPLGDGVAQLRAARDYMCALHDGDRPVQVDLRTDADVRLPHAVGDELDAAAHLLWHLSAPGELPPHLAAYLELFQERYGSDLVPIKELLDPERGLDAPAGYQLPSNRRHYAQPRHSPTGSDGQRRTMADLLASALRTGQLEVELTSDIAGRMGQAPDRAPAPSAELCVQVLASSVDALNAGEFRLALTDAHTSWQAGAFFGRFMYLFDGGREQLAQLVTAADPDAVQLVFQPSSARTGNVTQVPIATTRTLHVGTFADPDDPTALTADHVLVGADDQGFYLVDARTGKPLRAVLPHMANARMLAPNVVRLIREITSTTAPGWVGWDWSAYQAMPFLPQVRYGRTILSPARWRPSPELLDGAPDFDTWRAHLAAWRERWQVPRIVHTWYGDNFVVVDLDRELDQRMLRDDLRRRSDTLLVATIVPDGWDSGTWLHGYANEIVVPFRAVPDADHSHATRLRSSRPATRVAYGPGSPWLYAKLYASAELHDTLLAAALPELVAAAADDIDRWFFIRYRDPAPHLRIRFHCRPGGIGPTLTRLHEWATPLIDAGMARQVLIDTYAPEVERYGGPDAIEAAERVFHADSDAALRQLTTRVPAVDAGLLIALNMAAVARAYDAPGWQDWLLETFAREERREVFRACRADALRLMDLSGAWDALRAAPGGSDLVAGWQVRDAALGDLRIAVRDANPHATHPVLGSVLHMTHNRFVGVDRDSETGATAILRGVVEARRNRTRFGS